MYYFTIHYIPKSKQIRQFMHTLFYSRLCSTAIGCDLAIIREMKFKGLYIIYEYTLYLKSVTQER
jgi:hypothetical protein